MEKMFLLTMHGDDYHGDIIIGVFRSEQQARELGAVLNAEQVPCEHCGDKRYPIVCAVDLFPTKKVKG